MSRRPRQLLSSGTLLSAEVPLISLKKTQSHSEASLQGSDSERNIVGPVTKTGQRYRRKISEICLDVITDVLLAMLSIGFLVYGITVAALAGTFPDDDEIVVGTTQAISLGIANKQSNASLIGVLIEISKVGPTIFPILFAAALGRAIKTLTLWRLERGERLGILDLFAGSTSTLNAVLTPISLRLFNVVGIILAAVWALGPLGGQASLRTMTIDNYVWNYTQDVTCLSANHSFDSYATAHHRDIDLINGLFASAAYAVGENVNPDVASSTYKDVWNNARVPIVEEFDADLLANNTWIGTPNGVNATDYVSTIGIPVTPGAVNYTTSFETFYWRLGCSNVTANHVPEDITDMMDLPPGWHYSGNEDLYILHYSPTGENATNGSQCRGDPYDQDYSPRTLAYNSYDLSGNQVGVTCSMYTTYVEVELWYTSYASPALATIGAIRNSTQRHPSPAWTILDGPEGRCDWANDFFSMFTTANDTIAYFMNMLSGNPMDANEFAFRFAQLLNGYWMVTANPSAVLLADPYPFGFRTSALPEGWNETTKAQAGIQLNVVTCHWIWLAVLLASSTLLLLASVVSITLRLMNHSPPLTLNWTTLTMDNPYVDKAIITSTMNSSERSRLMKDHMVRFGDVEPERDIGHLAVASMKTHNIAKVTEERLFD